MSRKWEEAKHSPVIIWSEFEGKTSKRKYWTQCVNDELTEEIIKHIPDFVNEEILCKNTGFPNDLVSILAMEEMVKITAQDRLTIVCLTKGEDGKSKLVGFNNLAMEIKGAPEDKDVDAEGLNKLVKIVHYLYNIKDFFQTYNKDAFLGGRGMYVLPEFRQDGIGLELVKARDPLCKMFGIPASCTIFSSVYSQRIAEKAGYEVLAEVSYDELTKVDPTWTFPYLDKNTTMCKNMIKIF